MVLGKESKTDLLPHKRFLIGKTECCFECTAQITSSMTQFKEEKTQYGSAHTSLYANMTHSESERSGLGIFIF